MAKDKISDYSSTANSNTDIAGINIDEGCAPSGINDAIRTLMAQLKNFQTGTGGDSFNGPVGSTTASTGAFTTITTTGTINNITVGRGAGSVSTNTAVGASALGGASNSGNHLAAFGKDALGANSSGVRSVAAGSAALSANTTGSYNVGVGTYDAGGAATLASNTTGSNLVAVGIGALASNTTASNNTAVGYQAGYANTTGASNAFIGYQAGTANTTGSQNSYLGYFAGGAMTTGSSNTIVGRFTGNQGGLDIRTANNNIVISDGDGNPRLYFVGADVAWKSAAIYNFTSANSANMYIGSGYDIGRITSALKYKQDIRDLEEINIDLFRPVRYKSKCANDDQTKDYFGFIADEVADAGIEELVVRNAEGEVESFAYDRMTVVLLKEVQRLKAEVNALKGQA